jgi:GDP/UDP-N,N'-diacetylbacillosamine 2-epimerase (hydrolysing)
MSSLHFTSTEEYRKRVLQLGEPDNRVFNVGAIGLDSIRQMPLLDSEQLQQSLNFSFNGNTMLITYHPVTLERNSSAQQMQQVLSALDEFRDGKIIFTMPNADANGKVIRTMIVDFVNRNPERSAAFDSLGQQKYLSVMRQASVVVGNSSSGIIEAPSFGIPTVNIGDRQKGRIAAESIIHCAAEKSAIVDALKKAFDPKYKEFCRQVKNPYGDGDTTQKIISVLKKNLYNVNLKKEFVDRI